MKTTWALIAIAATALLAGCSGGNSVTAALTREGALETFFASPAHAAGQDETRREGQRPEGHKGHRGQGKERLQALIDSGCATKTGSPQEGGQLTFNNCTGERGSMSGTITWSAPAKNSDGSGSMTTSKRVTIGKSAEGKGGVRELGMLRGWAEAQGIQLVPEQWDSAEVASDITMSGTRGDRESFRRTGTTAVTFLNGGAIAGTVSVTFNGDKTATVNANGQTFNIDFAELREQWKANHPEGASREPKHRERPAEGKVQADPASLPTTA